MLTPKQQGFVMPAEWETHQATWLTWPYDINSFPDRIAKVEQVFAKIIYHLHQHEFIELLLCNKKIKQRALILLKQYHIDFTKINLHIVDYTDVWIRDYGPIFLIKNNNKLAWVKWQYNAYGKKFPELLKDNNVTYQLNNYIQKNRFEPDMILEGGSIEVNGQGTLITTEECLLNSNRNYHFSKEQTENYLKDYLGVTKIIWLEKGIVNDHTDGHVDEIARFVNHNTIAVAYENNKNDPNFEILNNNLHILQNTSNLDGNPFNLVKLPMPNMTYDNGEKAPVSYTNFYIANGLVLVPQFNHKYDKLAIDIIQTLFPERKIIGIDCTDLIYGGGALHCITQQQPVSVH